MRPSALYPLDGFLNRRIGTEDASKILSSDAACPICDQVLSKSLMKPVDINPNDEWTNMAMAGIAPQFAMKGAYRSVMFFIGQKELESQYKLNKIVGQCRQKCEAMQEKFTEKLEQLHTAYQKLSKRCQMLEQELECVSKDKQELQEKFAEKSRQKRKLDEMYDQLRSENDSLKRSAIQPASNFFQRVEPELFSSPANMMDNRDHLRQGSKLEGGLVVDPVADMHCSCSSVFKPPLLCFPIRKCEYWSGSQKFLAPFSIAFAFVVTGCFEMSYNTRRLSGPFFILLVVRKTELVERTHIYT
ncbi:E3 ubiquitin-protein ligase CCNB1IP1 homolog isoform X4 [Magnolia sinica]|uniref:E3 ubiquitin-protein ligase CCNB1IP1 homolog isoform X4 n=1 Tax=Magnolia sinica TaxID=86752 RepID=UPI00265A9C4B|nr:E3 ubiquitin-protein ligase CCNB1IP1 homolog isoform X4 [Magnolia sinica]XP_058100990.1 E3 ubiquitin-protein ligase CCNB1IP1 homolog isoform X4 [Magnolia sinica]XP_058100991.1 E3 ubiquitin-protein ligase CCNB1IP1 homolog isoform X4 [Magnolia sinica]